ncbi:Ankyrin repeat protein 1 [Giardia muris]|uniref:Ankyrin repeat protein 1 n=1 Tax=Giardia muris TaxID=5742 RepID=A0A4Z1T2A1_GIAMU|nr:Ankyrin repeat protein 1 [Giardia muris]|eukprot:TNJ26541.1 Ankyrin repeat protein 1 [Giardia muris]
MYLRSQDAWFRAIAARDYATVRENVAQFQRVANDEGETGLMLAVRARDLEMAHLLAPFEHSARNKAGLSAMMIAAMLDAAHICQKLAPYEAGLTTDAGLSALMLAAKYGALTALGVLIPFQKGRTDLCGRTALMYAAANGQKEAAQQLALREAHYRDNEGRSAADLARDQGYDEIASFLLSLEQSSLRAPSIQSERSGSVKIAHLRASRLSSFFEQRSTMRSDSSSFSTDGSLRTSSAFQRHDGSTYESGYGASRTSLPSNPSLSIDMFTVRRSLSAQHARIARENAQIDAQQREDLTTAINSRVNRLELKMNILVRANKELTAENERLRTQLGSEVSVGPVQGDMTRSSLLTPMDTALETLRSQNEGLRRELQDREREIARLAETEEEYRRQILFLQEKVSRLQPQTFPPLPPPLVPSFRSTISTGGSMRLSAQSDTDTSGSDSRRGTGSTTLPKSGFCDLTAESTCLERSECSHLVRTSAGEELDLSQDDMRRNLVSQQNEMARELQRLESVLGERNAELSQVRGLLTEALAASKDSGQETVTQTPNIPAHSLSGSPLLGDRRYQPPDDVQEALNILAGSHDVTLGERQSYVTQVQKELQRLGRSLADSRLSTGSAKRDSFSLSVCDVQTSCHPTPQNSELEMYKTRIRELEELVGKTRRRSDSLPSRGSIDEPDEYQRDVDKRDAVTETITERLLDIVHEKEGEILALQHCLDIASGRVDADPEVEAMLASSFKSATPILASIGSGRTLSTPTTMRMTLTEPGSLHASGNWDTIEPEGRSKTSGRASTLRHIEIAPRDAEHRDGTPKLPTKPLMCIHPNDSQGLSPHL